MTAFTTPEVKEFVAEWFRKLDVHAPVEEFLPMLHVHGLDMRFPEETLKTIDDFKRWYTQVTNLFFDQSHTLKQVDVKCDGDTARVNLVVNWQTRMWSPPAAKSTWLNFHAFQSWTLICNEKTGKLAIVTYVVEKLEPLEGSASL